jgi:hypothetical protein
MEPIRVKFVVETGGDNVSEALDSLVDEITTEWIRFMLPAHVLEDLGLNPDSVPSSDIRILMLIDLDPAEASIESTGRIQEWEPSSDRDTQGYSITVEFDEIAPEDLQRILDCQEAREAKHEDRRQEMRRDGDRFFSQVQRMLETLVDMSEGQSDDFGGQFADLVDSKEALGRRSEDEKMGDSICTSIERLGSYIGRTAGPSAGLRKVQIRKVRGKQHAAVEKGTAFVGWEAAPPEVGRAYFIYLESGGVFRSAPVRHVSENHFRTRNSLYEIEPA